MNRRRLIVVLEEQIFVYDISNMKLLHTIDTSPNPSGKHSGSYLRHHPLLFVLLIPLFSKRYAHYRLPVKIAILHIHHPAHRPHHH